MIVLTQDIQNIVTGCGSMTFEDFLNIDSIDEFEWLTGVKLRWYQSGWLRWWIAIKRDNPHLDAVTLFESIRKGRF